MLDSGAYLLVVLVGAVSGAVNVVAGGGSFLTLPILIFMGLPPMLANGTNRVGILLQNISAVWTFRSRGLFDAKVVYRAALPAAAGAAFGTYTALLVGDEAFRQILAVLMVVVTLWTLWNPLAAGPEAEAAASVPWWLLSAGFLCVGFYGGFVQAGVGFFILAMATLSGIDLVRGNSVKVLIVLVFTLISLPLFAWQQQVDWRLGLSLGAGTFLGARLGVHLTILKGHSWVKRVVTALILIFAVQLWF